MTAAGVLCVMAVANMHAWLSPDLLPAGDFAGYVTVVDDVRDAVLRHGMIPSWSPRWFGGTSRFMSSFKEIAALPLVVLLGGVRGTEATILLSKVVAAVSMYGLFARYFRSPAAGLVAGYAYAFCMISNYAAGKLDVAVSMVLFPLVAVAAIEALRLDSLRWAIVLGTLTACEFCNNPAQSVMCVALVAILAAIRPWRGAADPVSTAAPVRNAPVGTATVLAVAFVVLGLFAASQLAWIVADSRNHALFRPEHVARWIERFIEQSPFVFVNRGNWLGGWLVSHHPPNMDLFTGEPLVNQRHYLGIVAVAVCGSGWFIARKEGELRRWYQALALLLLVQYWLSMGPRSLIWQIAQALHWSEGLEGWLTLAACVGAACCLAWTLFLIAWDRRAPRHGRRERIELAAGLSLVLVFAGYPLFTTLREIFPPLQGMRAPGHFFELVPFSLYFLFGLGSVAIDRSLPRGLVRTGVVSGIAVALVLDFWPGVHAFSLGSRLGPVREFRDSVTAATAPEPLARIALRPGYSPTSWVDGSFVASESRAGVAWGWLPWQAGRYWPPYLKGTLLWMAAGLDEEERELLRPISDALGSMGRIRYVLDEPGPGPGIAPAAPWKRRAVSARFALWERPTVMPPAYGLRSYAVFAGNNDFVEALAVYYAFKHNMPVLSGGERLSAVAGPLLDGATVVVAGGVDAIADPGSAALARMYADRLVLGSTEDLATGYDAAFAGTRARALVDVGYERAAPDHIRLTLDAGGEPAIVFVSESYHPWWRARVDGRPARLLRAGITFMAMPVGTGRHTIVMRFAPPAPVVAAQWTTRLAWCAALAWIALAGVRLVRFRRPVESRARPTSIER